MFYLSVHKQKRSYPQAFDAGAGDLLTVIQLDAVQAVTGFQVL